MPCAALTALQGLRDKAQVKPGQKVLINGAGGGVGTFAVQIAKWLGAEVTAVCGPAQGGHGALDRRRPRHRLHAARTSRKTSERYDVVFDIGGNRSLRRLRRILTPTGTLVFVGAPHFRFVAPLLRVVRGTLGSRFSEQKLFRSSQHSQDDLLVLKELVEAGSVTPVVDRTYPLSEAAEAIRYLEQGHARGKVVITV